jgi:polyamine oxidase
MKALAEPVNDRLAFAGEATVPEFFGTVHGAYQSGVREAERILG